MAWWCWCAQCRKTLGAQSTPADVAAQKLNLDPAGLWPTWLCGLLGGPRETAEFFAESTLAPGVWYVEEDKNELSSS